MRPGFTNPMKWPYPYKAHPPLYTYNGKVLRRRPGYRQVIAPTNGTSVATAIMEADSKAEQRTDEPVQVRPVDLSKDLFTIGELVSLEYETYPYLLEKFIPKGCISFLAGSSDSGKSLFTLNLAISIITDQKEYIGQKIDQTYGKVLLISSEDGPIALSIRIKKLLNGKNLLNTQRERMIILTNSDGLYERVKGILSHYSVDLIILDAFGDVFAGDINTSNHVRLFLDKFDRLIQKHNSSMLIIHHIAKGKERQAANKGQLLGSVGIEGKSREVMILSKDASMPSKRTLKVVKANYASEEDKRISYELIFDPETLTYKSMGTALQEFGIQEAKKTPGRKVDREKVKKVFELKEEGNSGAEIAELMDIHPSNISRWLTKYKEEYSQ